jgi:transposase
MTGVEMQSIRERALSLLADGRASEAIELLMEIIALVDRDKDALAARLLAQLRHRFGAKSEKAPVEQLLLALEQLGADAPASIIAEEPPGPVKPPSRQRPSSGARGKKPLPNDLPRVTKVIAVPASARVCAECGSATETAGYRTSELVEYEPGRIVILEERREQVTCTRCSAPTQTAESEQAVDCGRPGPALLAKIAVDKMCDGMPLERQSKAFERLGVAFAPSTLGDWFAWTMDLVMPLGDWMHAEVLRKFYIQADDTSLKVQEPKNRPAIKRGHLWCLVGYDDDRQRTIVFRYAPDWSAAEAKIIFNRFQGTLQGDGYGGFDHMGQPPDTGGAPPIPDDRRLGCGMHVRRKFEAAWKAKDARGAVALIFFRKLYAIEGEIADADVDERLRARQERSLPIVDDLYQWIGKTGPTLVPGTLLAKAITYAKNQERRWRRCFDDGRYFIDNGEPERQIRFVATGRKNFLFAGSDAGARRLAVGYTLVANCRVLGLNPQEYLQDVIEKLADGWLMARIGELTPAAWKRARDQARAGAMAAAVDHGDAPDPAVLP